MRQSIYRFNFFRATSDNIFMDCLYLQPLLYNDLAPLLKKWTNFDENQVRCQTYLKNQVFQNSWNFASKSTKTQMMHHMKTLCLIVSESFRLIATASTEGVERKALSILWRRENTVESEPSLHVFSFSSWNLKDQKHAFPKL